MPPRRRTRSIKTQSRKSARSKPTRSTRSGARRAAAKGKGVGATAHTWTAARLLKRAPVHPEFPDEDRVLAMLKERMPDVPPVARRRAKEK
jgi:hypothetical protein